MGTSKYPRPRQRIAPATLSGILNVPLPVEFGDVCATGFRTLADLDDSVWDHASASTCRELGILVLHRVQRRWAGVRSKSLPTLYRSVPLSALEIEVRTFNCLVGRFREDLRPLNDLCI